MNKIYQPYFCQLILKISFCLSSSESNQHQNQQNLRLKFPIIPCSFIKVSETKKRKIWIDMIEKEKREKRNFILILSNNK